jgi:hypothetical protein
MHFRKSIKFEVSEGRRSGWVISKQHTDEDKLPLSPFVEVPAFEITVPAWVGAGLSVRRR